MATNSEVIRTRKRGATEVVVGFSPASVSAPFLLRCSALLIDYLIVACVPVLFLFFARFLGESGSNLLNGDLNSFGWLLAILIAIADLILLPVILGQSVGKLFTGIRIVTSDGNTPSVKRMLLRQTIGYFITLVTFGIGFFISAFGSSGRSLHDLLFGTVVIQGNKESIDSKN
jgi:uncharacterized RDD family membrane protein YckC